MFTSLAEYKYGIPMSVLTGVLGAENGPSPALFSAATRHSYSVSSSSPVTVNSVPLTTPSVSYFCHLAEP